MQVNYKLMLNLKELFDIELLSEQLNSIISVK